MNGIGLIRGQVKIKTEDSTRGIEKRQKVLALPVKDRKSGSRGIWRAHICLGVMAAHEGTDSVAPKQGHAIRRRPVEMRDAQRCNVQRLRPN